MSSEVPLAPRNRFVETFRNLQPAETKLLASSGGNGNSWTDAVGEDGEATLGTISSTGFWYMAASACGDSLVKQRVLTGCPR